MSNVNWLLIGGGDIANKRVAPALTGAENSNLVGVCDIRKEEAEKLGKSFGVEEIYSDAVSAIKETSADSVYLATPVGLHVEHACAALEAGKNVLIEKPLALNAEDCDKVISAAERGGKTAGCSYYRRCFNRYNFTKDMIKNGEFGKIINIRMTMFSWFNPEKDDPKYWRVVRSKSGGGPLSDMGTHMFDVLIGLLGMPEKVYAKCENLTTDWDVEDSAVIIMTMPDGAQITASFNWNSKTWRHEFEIIGTEGKIDWLPYDAGPIVKTIGRDIREIEMQEAENVHQPIVEDFINAVINGKDPVCSVVEAKKTNVLLDAVYRSSAENREIII
ncbi:MAG: Gfo/Idh/MocA family protein [Planctomycetota bacterium]